MFLTVLVLLSIFNCDPGGEVLFMIAHTMQSCGSGEEVFEEALENLATFKAKELRIRAAQEDISVSKSLYFPEISLFGQLNTNYSSAPQVFYETGSQLIETWEFVSIGNEEIPVLRNEPQYAAEEILYYDQFSNKLNSVVGVAVNIPLFNGFRAKHEVALQEIQLEESKVEYLNTISLFRKAIKEAHANMEAAYKKIHLLQNQVAAYRESFRVNEIRFNNGVSNIMEYIISKNNLDQAKINLINAKYEYMLRVKVLEYYRGNG